MALATTSPESREARSRIERAVTPPGTPESPPVRRPGVHLPTGDPYLPIATSGDYVDVRSAPIVRR
ncbi:hypothetical protein [Actinoallomurus vinaceus]|uniref:hypothetical protein n=1 Tax=Actinoallomurus vinaceus TaxID=1080074 RepID=UPI0031F11159